MPHFNIDLEDGKPPVRFALNLQDADRFVQFMAECQGYKEALEAIQRYGLDTLSGRVDGPDDRDWQRSAVNEMTKRARLALEGKHWSGTDGVAGPLAEQCAEHGECTEKAMGEPECAGRCKAHERALGVKEVPRG